jgi:hypothetical protein
MKYKDVKMASITILNQIMATYRWFKSSHFGYPIRKLEKAIPDLIIGLKQGDSNKPVSRNVAVVVTGIASFTIGMLTPLVFDPKMLHPLTQAALKIVNLNHYHSAGTFLTVLAAFLFASLVARLAIQLCKFLYQKLNGHPVHAGHVTNMRMLIPQHKKTELAQNLCAQIQYSQPNARFRVQELDAYATAIQDRYVKFRDLADDFDGNVHARTIAAESNITTVHGARAELANAKEALHNLRHGNWPAVKFYIESLEAERTNHRAFFESQRERIENLQRHLRITSNSQAHQTGLAEEGEIHHGPSLSHLNHEQTLALLTREAAQINPVQSTTPFLGWQYRQKTVHPIQTPMQDLESNPARNTLTQRINVLQGPVLQLPSLSA